MHVPPSDPSPKPPADPTTKPPTARGVLTGYRLVGATPVARRLRTRSEIAAAVGIRRLRTVRGSLPGHRSCAESNR